MRKNNNIFLSSEKLINALHLLKNKKIAGDHIASETLFSLQELAKQLKNMLEESYQYNLITSEEKNAISICKEITENNKEINLDSLIKNIESISVTLNIQIPELILIITAPFDEEARTGDGQYAKSLVEAFKKYSKKTECIWLKLNEQHYTIPALDDIKALPENIVPSLAVLQPVANGKTVFSSYQSLSDDFSKAKDYVLRNLTPRTPQLIYNKNKELKWIAFVNNGKNVLIDLTIINEAIAGINNDLSNKEKGLNEKQVAEKENLFKKLKQLRSQLCTSQENKQEIIEEIKSIAISHNAAFSHENLNDFLSKLFKEIEQIKKSQVKEIDLYKKAGEQLNLLANQFDAEKFNAEKLIKIISDLNTLYDFTANRIILRSSSIPGLKNEEAFELALKKANDDPLRKEVINQLMLTITKLSAGKKCLVDIHIRPPDTGVLMMLDDIKLLKQQGILVNLTVHEYQQNYTRRYLQRMTHHLLEQADSVLFFNEKDGNSAIKASEDGDLHHSRRHENNWPIKRYELKSKVHYTVASQILSKQPQPPLEVIKKAPNILCFGTIRPGKGFEEARDIAKEILHLSNGNTSQQLPIVIIAGDPQDNTLMQELFELRYGDKLFKNYIKNNPLDKLANSCQAKRMYWKNAKAMLEEQISAEVKLHNSFLEIYTWCDEEELIQLQARCKYICRMDDMGMRNNGSAIISVLHVGIVYTKHGCVTDDEYWKENGAYHNAVDLGANKYGKNKANKKWDEKNKIFSNYRREPFSRHPKDILLSILERERDQRMHATDLTASKNYQTVVLAQKLLTDRFSLENSMRNLLFVGINNLQKSKTLNSNVNEPEYKNNPISANICQVVAKQSSAKILDISELDELSKSVKKCFTAIAKLTSTSLFNKIDERKNKVAIISVKGNGPK